MSSPYACLILLHVWIARLGGELEFLAAEDSCDVLHDDEESAEDARMDKRETHDISKVGVNDGLNDTSNDGNGVKGAFGKVPVFGSWMVVQKKFNVWMQTHLYIQLGMYNPLYKPRAAR